MKKLYVSERWKTQSARRSSYELRRHQAHQRYVKRRNAQRSHRHTLARRGVYTRLPHHTSRVSVSAPAIFSLIKNPIETLQFLDRLQHVFRRRQDAHVDLANVIDITSDAVLVLLAKLNDRRFVMGRTFGGNEPMAAGPRSLLDKSGFFEFVRSATLKAPPADGRIRREISTKVEAVVAEELVHFATLQMLGLPQDRRAAYRSLVECMANTHEHSAGENYGTNLWWANVYCPQGGRRSFFTIVDTGVGIFKSVTVRRVRRLMTELVGASENARLFRDWLDGKIEMPSRTGRRNRGKGLLAIYKRWKEGRDGMRNLIIIANDVYANLAEDRIETMPTSFRGTFVYWELEG